MPRTLRPTCIRPQTFWQMLTARPPKTRERILLKTGVQELQEFRSCRIEAFSTFLWEPALTRSFEPNSWFLSLNFELLTPEIWPYPWKRWLATCPGDSSGDSLAEKVPHLNLGLKCFPVHFFSSISQVLPISPNGWPGRVPAGTEGLISILNSYFGRLLDLVSDHGGDTLKMAGDGLVVAWEAEDSDRAGEPAIRAVHCAEEIQRDSSSASSESRLTVRIGIGFGETHIFYVGGLFNRWELIPIGEPLRQMGIAQSRAKPGEIVVSADCWTALGNEAEGEPLDSGLVRIRRLRAMVPPRPWRTPWKTNVARDRIGKVCSGRGPLRSARGRRKLAGRVEAADHSLRQLAAGPGNPA